MEDGYSLTPIVERLDNIIAKLDEMDSRLTELERGQNSFARSVAELMKANELTDDKVDSFILDVLDIRRKLRKDAA